MRRLGVAVLTLALLAACGGDDETDGAPLTTIPGGVVGSVITMANPPLYEQYGIATRMWGLGVQTDQEIAGLMMWVGENTIYLILITVIFMRWANAEERKDRMRPEMPVPTSPPISAPSPPVEANGHTRAGVPRVGEGV